MSRPSPSRPGLRDRLAELTGTQIVSVFGVFTCIGLKAGLHLNVGEFLTVFGAMFAYEGVRKAKREAE